jgi:hypothetical protein
MSAKRKVIIESIKEHFGEDISTPYLIQLVQDETGATFDQVIAAFEAMSKEGEGETKTK